MRSMVSWRGVVGVVLWAMISARSAPAQAPGQGLGFEEQFALSTDRRALLEQLIPGSDDFYFYSCLERQHAGDYAAVDTLLRAWNDRHGSGSRMERIEYRQALLRFESAPDGTWRFLRERLGLNFSHQREVPGEKPNLPTSLDPKLVSDAEWVRRAFARHTNSVEGFRGAALERLTEAKLDDAQLASLLQRLPRPDVANLPALIVRQLAVRTAQKFGSLPIHRKLTLDQLEECARLEPKLLAERAFVDAWIAQLAPGADEDIARDRAARSAHLGRLQSFVMRLSGAFNSLKAHVLYRRLEFDLAAGKPDLETFRAYLKLPRPTQGVHPKLVERRSDIANLGESFATGLPPVGDDEVLVRAYLEHFLRDAADSSAFTELIEPRYLERAFAEIKILAGLGDQERWYSLLDDPGYYEQLKQRVELRFAPTQPEWFAADAPVAIELDVKNVATLLVKVYEIHALNFYAEEKREIDASIALDGLVANEETTIDYQDSPLRRMRRRFDFPKLTRPGVYVVEFIGNGSASRAVVRKGRLHLQERIGSAGHVFRVLDESGVLQRDAALHFEGRRFAADERGDVLLPFTTDAGTKTLIVEAGERVSLESFEHLAEKYELACGAFIERETLLSGERATLIVRPMLAVQGRSASLTLLENVVLTIESKDFDGVASSVELRAPEWNSSGEFVHTIAVPARLARLSVSLRAKVTTLSTATPIELAASASAFELSTIVPTNQTDCPLLGRSAKGWFLDVLGRNGEPRVDRAVSLNLTHRDYTDAFDVTLKTDAAGRIELGKLEGVESLLVTGFPNGIAGWRLDRERRTQTGRLHGIVGQVMRVPYLGAATAVTRANVSLLELRGEARTRDAFDHVKLIDGYLELRDLAAGDYELVLEDTNQVIAVAITTGQTRDGWAFGRSRALELGAATPLHVVSLSADKNDLVVQLRGAGADARVHVFATRYLPAYDPFASIPPAAGVDPNVVFLSVPECDYRSGREIGDEFQYILARRFARKFPGNLLHRPSLLLNPWALDESDTSLGLGGGAGGAFGGRSGGKKNLRARGGSGTERGLNAGPAGIVPDLDFLGAAATIVTNLRPGTDGIVRVPLADLGLGQHVHVLALDARERVYASLALAEKTLQPKDQRLSVALDSTRHLSESRNIEFVKAGGTTSYDERATEGLQTYETLADIYGYFRTRSGDVELAKFAFLVRWPELSVEEKRTLYSEHACHELNVFLHSKDAAFFAEVIRPYLANKFDKQFIDRWLLDENLERFVEPWAFAQLNIVERILLTKRLGARAAAGARHVRELFELLPPNLGEVELGFATALSGSALISTGSDDFFLGKGAKRELAPPTAAPAPDRQAEKSKDDGPHKGPGDTVPSEEGLAQRLEDKVMQDAEERDAAQRPQAKALYVPVAATRTFAESNYWHRRIAEQDADLITVNSFWNHFAQAAQGEPFVSEHFTVATRNVSEMLLALAVLDLPFKAGEHEIRSDAGRRTLRAASPLLVVRKDLRDTPQAAEAAPLLVSQDFFRLDDPSEFVGNEQRDKFVRGEFLMEVGYGCRVVVTNPTSSSRDLELLVQVPAGSVPLAAGRPTRGQRVQLKPYGTQSLHFAFYFPRPGRFVNYPVQVSQAGELVAFAQPATFDVLAEPSAVDSTSWDYVSQRGSTADVLAYLGRANLKRLELDRIAWRMRERGFHDALLPLLRERLSFNGVLWSYAVFHADATAAREFLRWNTNLAQLCGPYFDSPLLRIDPVERRAYEHLEFDPLVNPRAHPFGRRREILNSNVAAQYRRLLEILVHRPKLDDHDWMSVTYSLLLQDRVEEALASFAKIDPARLESQLQYDYLRAYLDFFSDQHSLARAIAEKYREHPIARWRAMFGDVLSQLDEVGGAKPTVSDERDREQRQGALAANEPALELELEGRNLILAHRNVESCEVSYYPMDIEFLFSTNPFVQQNSRGLAFIRPRRTDVVVLPADSNAHTFELPSEFRSSNVLVEVRAGGLVRRKPCLQTALRVQWLESFGQLNVTNSATGKPSPKVYVKVYAREANGKVRFHKDGYTDLRGRFDYASLSGSAAESATRFAVLIASDAEGAVIAEVNPPAR